MTPSMNEAPFSIYSKEHTNYLYYQRTISLDIAPDDPIVYSAWNLFVETMLPSPYITPNISKTIVR